jgi:hypothetical protein
MSAFVVWDSIRKFDSRSVRLAGKNFSTDKLNLTNEHSFAASSSSHKNAVGITTDAKGKIVALTAVSTKASKPKKAVAKTGLGVSSSPRADFWREPRARRG